MDYAGKGEDPNHGLSKSVIQDLRVERKVVTLMTFAVLAAAAGYIVSIFIAAPLSIHLIVNEQEKGCDPNQRDDCFAPTDESQLQLTLVLTLLRIMTFLMGSFVGTLSDKVGRKPLIIAALCCYTVTGLLFLIGWVTSTVGLFILGGMVLGAASPVTPYGVSVIADISRPDRLATNMATLQGFGYFLGLMSGALLALAIGQATTGQVEDPVKADYDKLFYGSYCTTMALCGSAALIVAFFKPESLHPDERVDSIDWKKANPFGFAAIVTRNPYIMLLWLSAFFGWMGVGAGEAVTGGWWLRRYTQTDVNQFIIFIVAIWIASGFGAVIMTRIYVALRGLKFAIHISYFFTIMVGVVFAVAPTVATSYVAVAITFFATAVVPTLIALIMGQVPANEKGALAGALRSSEALAKVIGIVLFGNTFAIYIEELARFELYSIGLQFPISRRPIQHLRLRC